MADFIGSVGVGILLLAFAMNAFQKWKMNSLPYLLCNASGAMLACIASVMIHYMPFIILEVIWTAVSVVAIFKYFKTKK